MITSDKLTVVDSGNGFTIGEIKDDRFEHLPYLERGALVVLADGVDKVLDLVANKMPNAKHNRSSEDTGRGEFNAFSTYEEALTTFRGTPEKVVEFSPTELRIKDTDEAGSNVDYDVTGDFIDMGRYMEGIPEVMGSMKNGNARNRRVNIMVNLNQTWNIDHQTIIHRGERTLRLVDALEAGGVRTQLTGIESTECGHIEVIAKHHDEPLTVSDLAVLVHPEFLRRIVFRINEHSKTWSSGYGSSIRFSHALKPEIIEGGNINELDILIDANIVGKSNIDTLFDQLERLLVWEMSKPVPEVSSVKLDSNGIWFNPNGARSESDIRREGQEALRG